MQRFGNLKLGSVFSFLHPKTETAVFGLKKEIKKIMFFCVFLKPKIETAFWFRFASSRNRNRGIRFKKSRKIDYFNFIFLKTAKN